MDENDFKDFLPSAIMTQIHSHNKGIKIPPSLKIEGEYFLWQTILTGLHYYNSQ